MNEITFDCDRKFLDLYTVSSERSFLVSLYCRNYYEVVNITRLFYDMFESNAITVLLLILILLVPLANYALNYIVSHYLVPYILHIKKTNNMDSVRTSYTLMAISCGLPSIIEGITASSKKSVRRSFACLYSSFIFNVTICTAIVLITSPRKEIKMPKVAVIKEIVFYLLSIIVLVIYGLMGQLTYTFAVLYFLIYVAYFLVSIFTDELEPIFVDHDPTDINEGPVPKAAPKPVRASVAARKSIMFSTTDFKQFALSKISKSQVDVFGDDFNVNTQEDQNEEERKKEDKLLTWEELKEVFRKETDLPGLSKLERVVVVPIRLFFLLFVPAHNNLLMKSFSRSVVYANSVWFCIYALRVMRPTWIFLAVYPVLLCVFLALKLVNVSKSTTSTIQGIFGIVTGLAISGFISGLFADGMRFLKFYYSFDTTITLVLLITSIQSIDKLYINIWLAKNNEIVLAILSSMSVEFFKNVAGFSVQALTRIAGGNPKFNIFKLRNEGYSIDQNKDINTAMLFLTLEIALIVTVLIILLIYYHSNKFIVKPNLIKLCVSFYMFFSITSLIVGLR